MNDELINRADQLSHERERALIDKQQILTSIMNLKQTIENLPQQAMIQSINHYDYLSLLMILESIVRSDCIEES